MNRRTFLAGSLLLLIDPQEVLAAFGGTGQWYPGIVHLHTTFSDGSDNIPQRAKRARGLGYSFMIVCDHLEQIASRDKASTKWYGQLLANRGVDVGFADYRRNCAEQTSASFVAIPGAEVQTVWHAEADTTDYSHTLAIGDIGKLAGSKPPVSQREVISWITRHGLLASAAHPSRISTMSATDTPWEWLRFRYDRRSPEAYEGIRGVEFFNDATPAQFAETLAWYHDLIKRGQRVFVTSGCDSHGWKEPSDEEKWQRLTYVYLDGKLTQAALLQNIGSGQTYAVARGTRLSGLNYRPGPTYRVKKPFEIGFRLSVGDECKAQKVSLYRDGKLVSEERLTRGASGKKYQLGDPQAPAGRHLYTIVVTNSLVTSPICLEVSGESPKEHIASASNPYFGTWTRKDSVDTSVLKISDGKFEFDYENNSITGGMSFPRKVKVAGTWRDNKKGRIQGTGTGNDGITYEFDASFVVKGKELYYSLTNHKKHLSFMCWVWRK